MDLTGRSSGGKEVGELWLETTSKSMKVKKVRLRLSADFPKKLWTEVAEVRSSNEGSL